MSLQGDFFDHQFSFDFDATPVSKHSMLEELVESIVQEIKAGMDDRWVMPWSKTLGLPVNAITGKSYEGRNMLLLWASASRNSYRSNRWATFKQWRTIGCTVPKGYKATRIFKPVNKNRNDLDSSNEQELIFRPIPVFNADQINRRNDMQPEMFPPNPYFEETRAEELINAVGAEIRFQGNSAYYNCVDDYIVIPPRIAFLGSSSSSEVETYYSTILHEMIHWTGHRSRCNRKMVKDRESPEYAWEELVAEIGAALLCHNLGLTPEIRPDHIQYPVHWKKHLSEEPEKLLSAAEHALIAVRYLQQSTAQISLEF